METIKERNERLHKKAEELRANGIKLYSISRLNSYHDCEYGYWNTYIDNNRGKGNVYSFAGSEIHDILEAIYLSKANKEDLVTRLNDTIITAELQDIKFPSESIKDSWCKDMFHFVNNFEKHDKKCETEVYFLFEIEEGIWINGYIDIFTFNEDGTVDVNDYKTSSKFQKKDIVHHSRQLTIYKLALEDMEYKVKNCAWNMLKYCSIKITTIDKKTKEEKITYTISQRGKIVSTLQAKINKMLLDYGMDELEANFVLEKAIEENSLEKLPKEIQDRFEISEYLLEHEVTNDVIEECKKYIRDTVKEIESKSDIEEDWKSKEITDKDNFFCNVLCNHRFSCKYLKNFNESKEFPDKKDENPNSIDALFA